MHKLFLIVILGVSNFAIAEPQDVSAHGDTITSKHRYTMGDNDSKTDATTMCFLEAKRKAVEYVGSYVESTVDITQTEKSRNAKSKVKIIAASLVSSEIVSVETGLDNGKVYVDCVVSVTADKNQLKKDIAKIAADPEANKQVALQQIQLQKLEDEIIKIQTRLSAATGNKAISLRQERTAVFKEIDTLQQKKLEIVALITKRGQDVQELVANGMTEEEVISLVGKPRAVKKYHVLPYPSQAWNYGTRWVLFDDGLVKCLSTKDYSCDR